MSAAQHTPGPQAGDLVTLTDGTVGEVVEVDAERDCLWIAPSTGEPDRRCWTRKVAAIAKATGGA